MSMDKLMRLVRRIKENRMNNEIKQYPLALAIAEKRIVLAKNDIMFRL